MRLKLYRAPSMAEAMAGVRAELGPEALILGARRVAGGIELTAALEPAETPPPRGPVAANPDLSYHGIPPALCARLAGGVLEERLARAFRFEPVPVAGAAPPLLLVGPPGAGKTLTIARLATRLVMSGARPLAISADSRRAGGVEQLAAFTRLLGIELLAAAHPVTLGRAVARRGVDAPVLVDGPGADPFDPAQSDEIAALAGATGANLALVLPGGLDPAEAAELAAAFAGIGAKWLVPTRLDQTRRLGGVLAAAEAGGLAFAEGGIGPNAADGLVPITPEFLAERLSRRSTAKEAVP
ncbi:MAG: GTP-binding protein [Acetobacteraceae bacterium]